MKKLIFVATALILAVNVQARTLKDVQAEQSFNRAKEA